MGIIHSKNYSITKNYSTKYSFKKFENYSFKKIIHFFEKLIIAQGYANHTILNYAKNVDAIYASKICEKLLTEAREIMKKDLYVAEEVKIIM